MSCNGAICDVCPHRCVLLEGEVGLCKSRKNEGGAVVGAGAGRLTSFMLDPVEKKPFARWHPGASVLSAGSYGCNMSCPWCQNAKISTVGEEDAIFEQRGAAELASRAKGIERRGCVGVALTFNEPLICWEFVCECAEEAHKLGQLCAVVTNGQANRPIVEKLAAAIDAANVDLKGFTQDLYDMAGGSLEAAKECIEVLHAAGCHVEVTTLVIPGLNDGDDEMRAMSAWLASVDPAIPYHLTQFRPAHQMRDTPKTPVETLERLAAVARENLEDVIVGA